MASKEKKKFFFLKSRSEVIDTQSKEKKKKQDEKKDSKTKKDVKEEEKKSVKEEKPVTQVNEPTIKKQEQPAPFSEPQKKEQIISDGAISKETIASPQQRSIQPTPKTTSPKYVIMLSGFTDTDRKRSLKEQVVFLGGQVISSSNFDERVTHLVVSSLSSRTVKFLCASLAGIWIVTAEWIEQSASNRTWLPENRFGSNHKTVFLDGKKIYMTSSFIKDIPDSKLQECQLLIKFGRAQLVQEALNANFILTGSGDKNNLLQTNAMTWQTFLELITKNLTDKPKTRGTQNRSISRYSESFSFTDDPPKYESIRPLHSPPNFQDSPTRKRSQSTKTRKEMPPELPPPFGTEMKKETVKQLLLLSKSPFNSIEKSEEQRQRKSSIKQSSPQENQADGSPNKQTESEKSRAKSSANIRVQWEKTLGESKQPTEESKPKRNSVKDSPFLQLDAKILQENQANGSPNKQTESEKPRAKSSTNIRAQWEQRLQESSTLSSPQSESSTNSPQQKNRARYPSPNKLKKSTERVRSSSSTNLRAQWEQRLQESKQQPNTPQSQNTKKEQNGNVPPSKKNESEDEEEEEEEENFSDVDPKEYKTTLLTKRKQRVEKMQKKIIFESKENKENVLNKIPQVMEHIAQLENDLKDENSIASKQTIKEFIQDYDRALEQIMKKQN